MRYLVTGAAGFIGSHLLRRARSSAATTRSAGTLHRLLRPGAEGGERPRPAGPARRPGRGRARPRRLRRRLPPRRASRASRSFGGVFPRLRPQNVLASQRLFEAAAEAASASSSRPRRPSTATRARTRRPRTPSRARSRRTGSRSSPASTSPTRTARSSGSRSSSLRYFTIFGPRQRPDMAFTRMVSCLAEGRPFELYGDGDAVAQLHVRRRRRRRDDRRDGARRRRADVQRRRRRGGFDARGDRDARADRRAGSSSSSAARAGEGDAAPHGARTRRGSARIWAGSRDRARGRSRGSVALGR